MDSTKSSTIKFFLLNPTREKIILSLFNSLVIVLITLIIPSLGFQSIFLSRGLSKQIVSLVINLLFSFVVYYPLACGLVYIYKIIKRKENISAQNLINALLFIIIFNPITFSLVTASLVKNNQSIFTSVNSVIDPEIHEKLCGLQIMEITTLSAKNTGLVVGEVINNVNNFPVDTMDALNRALLNEKPNETVKVITNVNTYNITLFANPSNPKQVLMGIKVKPTECKK